MIEFFMPMVPPRATAQERKVTHSRGSPVFYDPPKLKDARAKLTAHLSQHRPEHPYVGPARLVVKWCFPISKHTRHEDGDWKITRPDTDNLQKMLKDCMTRCGFWRDDAQVCSEIVEKFWSETPGIYVCVDSLAQKEE